MRRLPLALLLLAGCQIVPAPAEPPAPLAEPADAPDAPASAPPDTAPTLPEADSLARGPWGEPVSPDSLRALLALADTSASGTVGLVGRAGVFHGGEVPARNGERWQGL